MEETQLGENEPAADSWRPLVKRQSQGGRGYCYGAAERGLERQRKPASGPRPASGADAGQIVHFDGRCGKASDEQFIANYLSFRCNLSVDTVFPAVVSGDR